MITALLLATVGVLPQEVAPLPDTLSLVGVVERALSLDPSLAAARAVGDAAASGVDVARAGRLPSVASSAELIRFGEPMIVAPLHGFDPTTVPDFDRTLVQGRVGLDWTVWDGGATRARIGAARAHERGAEAEVDATRQARIADAVLAYLEVLTARDVAAAHAARDEALAAERDRVARRFDEGTAARVELLRAEAALSAARADREGARADLRAAEASLARLLEVSPAAVAATGLADVAPARPADPGAATVADHPDVLAAHARADAADGAAAEAAASRTPTVRASGGIQEFGGAASEFSTEWQAGLRVSWPVFTGGARKAAVARARAEARRADEEVAALERDLGDAADRARAALEEAEARATALARAVDQYEELARVEALALEEGVGVQSDWLLAEAGLLNARAGLARARRALVASRVALARALGILTLDWLTENTR